MGVQKCDFAMDSTPGIFTMPRAATLAAQLLFVHQDIAMKSSSWQEVGWGYVIRLAVFAVVFALVFGWLLRLPSKSDEESFGRSKTLKTQFASSPQSLPTDRWS